MKLILCYECEDVVRLVSTMRACSCGRASGRYVDDLNAEISGTAIPLSFANRSLAEACLARPDSGLGSRFEAFVIPRDCPTVKVLCKECLDD